MFTFCHSTQGESDADIASLSVQLRAFAVLSNVDHQLLSQFLYSSSFSPGYRFFHPFVEKFVLYSISIA